MPSSRVLGQGLGQHAVVLGAGMVEAMVSAGGESEKSAMAAEIEVAPLPRRGMMSTQIMLLETLEPLEASAMVVGGLSMACLAVTPSRIIG